MVWNPQSRGKDFKCFCFEDKLRCLIVSFSRLIITNLFRMIIMHRYHIPRSWLKASDNLLVIFEEVGGNPFDISIERHYSQIICGQVSETHYPPLHKWTKHDTLSATISIDDPTPEMYLECEQGHVIGSIEFASYGTPKGSCPSFQRSRCHAVNSERLVKEVRIKCLHL